jgi:hypothetical protein
MPVPGHVKDDKIPCICLFVNHVYKFVFFVEFFFHVTPSILSRGFLPSESKGSLGENIIYHFK